MDKGKRVPRPHMGACEHTAVNREWPISDTDSVVSTL